jgi:recombinational DNA repair ATPase RecF
VRAVAERPAERAAACARAGRRQRLVEFVINNEQVLITSADLEAVPDLLVAKRLEVVGGEVVG